ncbi:MAG: GntR family transcriptional regulator [Pleurocapsa minor GSE-CHR-MK-17-07R]|jgi:GntR family transcriptional regulator|nr:GntR family transcriptional regulator [Pleurocapsa minor GSE-CHR-MK 17-07R]
MINRHSFTPIYIQIAQAIIRSVEEGQYTYGAQLPSERELAERFNVSRLTARQANEELIKRGIAYRQQGKGTFVARPRIREVSGLISFSDEIQERGLQPSSVVLVQQQVAATDEMAKKFQVKPGTRLLELNRIRLADGQPIAVQYALINLPLCPKLADKSFDGESLYRLLRDECQVYPLWVDMEMEARIVNRQEAEWLNMQPGEAVLVAHCLTFTETFDVIEVVNSVYPGNRFPFYIGRQRIIQGLAEK